MERGDIYIVNLEPTIGHEQQGNRPVLIVSPAAFNRVTQLPIVVPITTEGNFARGAGFTVELIDTKTKGVIRCDQPRTIDIKARKGRKIETVKNIDVINEVLAKLAPIFE